MFTYRSEWLKPIKKVQVFSHIFQIHGSAFSADSACQVALINYVLKRRLAEIPPIAPTDISTFHWEMEFKHFLHQFETYYESSLRSEHKKKKCLNLFRSTYIAGTQSPFYEEFKWDHNRRQISTFGEGLKSLFYLPWLCL